jgi:large repetitive protein
LNSQEVAMASTRPATLVALLLTVLVACGDGNDNAGPVAGPTPSPALCGNGRLDPGEQCEPLEFCRGGCNPTAHICVDISCLEDCTCPLPVCGDAIVDPGEECDPPGGPPFGGCDLPNPLDNSFGLFACGADCQCDSPCGDGFLAPHEPCDDGNAVDGDGCSSTCEIENVGTPGPRAH